MIQQPKTYEQLQESVKRYHQCNIKLNFQNQKLRNEIASLENQIQTLQASTDQSKLLLADVSKRFSDADVRNIVLEMQNAAMYALSNNLSRFETRIELQKVKRKWKT